MKIIIKVINLIRGGNRSLSHKKFQAFLQDENLCLYNDENFKEIKFLSELAFLVDITCHLNHLNSQLQEQNHTISDLTGYINVFQNKLKLFIIELEINELYHFPSSEKIAKCHSNVNFLIFQLPLVEIQKQFHRCFKDFDLLKNDLQIFNNPKGYVINEQEIAYRLEEKYPKLIDLGLKICSMFGSTYKFQKESLCSLLRLATSTISIDIPSLFNGMSHPQFSH
ncbi:general transcription factor II-I repeat domain-containing protein 2-like [Vespula pensylvanica]|uniref:general transcription factor II-I repeat domain-containing protein 2-like n=1 Tax=Vespula pensylvanica TaxID=30213 RepID=UPI001CB9E726|nr:general transcription factor II-I repeat domain-containing protein 2-like [Vespula pensylvanica]